MASVPPKSIVAKMIKNVLRVSNIAESSPICGNFLPQGRNVHTDISPQTATSHMD